MSAREYVVRSVADGFHFLEGPRWRDGKLYFSDFYGGRVFALEGNGDVTTLCQLPQWASGLGFGPRGELLVVAVAERKLLRCADDGNLVEVADLSGLTSYNCNDMLVDENGRAYISNFGFDMPPTRSSGDPTPGERVRPTSLFMVSPDGEVSAAGDGLVFPNGMARTADGRTLIVAETFAGRLSAFDILEDGSLSGHRIWAAFTDRTFTTVSEALDAGVPLPDGIALDVDGAVWIADAGGTGVLRVAPGGEILDRVPTPGLAVFAVALGGPDLKTLYMCAGPPLYSHDPNTEKKSVLLATDVHVSGVPTS